MDRTQAVRDARLRRLLDELDHHVENTPATDPRCKGFQSAGRPGRQSS